MQPRRKRPSKRNNATAMHMVGAQVATFRVYAGFTQRQLAERLCMSQEKLASIEQGRRPLLLPDALQLDRMLETKSALVTALENMPEREIIPAWSAALIDNEQAAKCLDSYENHVVPGLLQTEEYARAVLSCDYPPVDEEKFQRRVALRMHRQKLLERVPPPAMSYVIEEVVLHRPIGGRDCLRRQLRHLRACAELPFVTLTVMPSDRETHAGLSGSMVLFETPALERIAYSEGQRGSVVVDDPEEVSNLYGKYGMLRSQALTPEATRSLLDELAGEE